MIKQAFELRSYSQQEKERIFSELGFIPKNEYLIAFDGYLKVSDELKLEKYNKKVIVQDINKIGRYYIALCSEKGDVENEG